MLVGTELSYAYVNDINDVAAPPKEQIAIKPVAQKQQIISQVPENPLVQKPRDQSPEHMDPNFLTSDQKLYMLSSELKKQKEFYENYSKGNTTYFDRLFSRKKEILKILSVALVFLLAISMHYVVDYYTKQFFDENVISAGRELFIRALYPACILFILWNLKVFTK